MGLIDPILFASVSISIYLLNSEIRRCPIASPSTISALN
jgi:hypothetical protein